jgi:hypothetical protein
MIRLCSGAGIIVNRRVGSLLCSIDRFRRSNPPPSPHASLSKSQTTYTRELDAAVAALGSSAALLDVKNAELAAGSLRNPRQVRRGVVPRSRAKLADLLLLESSAFQFLKSLQKLGKLTGSGDGR